MTFKSFRECVLHTFQEMYEGEVSIELKEVQKLNGVRRYGITFCGVGEEIAPTIYLEEYYEHFKYDKNVDRIVEEIDEVYKRERELFYFSIKDFSDFEKVKDQLFIKLIHRESNQELLQDTPYISFLEYAIVAYYELRQNEMDKGSILVKEEHCSLWGYLGEDIIAIARENAAQKKEALIQGMSGAMQKYIGNELMDKKDEMMFIVTNKDCFFGASVLYYPNITKKIEDYLGGDFYVLPSSVHELILVPERNAPSPEELLTMVQEVNDTQVEPEEVLSYSIYRYDAQNQVYTIIKGEKRVDN